MKIYFCEKCGISIPLQEVVGGRATARDGKTYCQGCLPRDRAEGEDLKLYFCDNCRVSIPLQDVITNRARAEGDSVLCTDCSRMGEGERAARREQVHRELEEREESRYRLHFCDRCNTSIPQSHIITGRAIIRSGRTFCERCAVRAERPRSGVLSAAVTAVVVVAVLVAGFMALGGPATVSGWFGESSPLTREEVLRREILAEVRKGAEERQRETDARVSALLAQIGELETRSENLSRSFEALRATAEENLRQQATLKAEVETRLRAEEAAFRAALERLDDLTDRLAGGAGGAPAEPGAGAGEAPPPAIPPEAPKVPEPAPPEAPKAPEPPVEIPPQVKAWIDQLASDDAGIRFAAAVELGKSGFPGAAEPLVKVLTKDKDTFVRRAAARSLGELNAWSAVPALIDTLEDKEFFVAVTAHKALTAITGQDFGFEDGLSRSQVRKVVQKAKDWWEQHKGDR